MAVSEQTDSLRVLGSDPVDYLIIPRAVACMIAGPILNLMCFCMGAPFLPSPSSREQPQAYRLSGLRLYALRPAIVLWNSIARYLVVSDMSESVTDGFSSGMSRSGSGGAGIACSMLIAELVYDVKARIILDSCVRAVTAWDIITSMIKAWVFGLIISVVRLTAGHGHQPYNG